jgi:hypothetical protein
MPAKKSALARRGRKSTYNDRDAHEIAARLSVGEPLAQICRDSWMPTDRTVRNWMEANAGFASVIARAREVGFDAIAQRTRLTARGKTEADGGDSQGDVQRDKLIIETDLKLLAKWDPKRYGERVQLAGDADAPIAVTIIERRIVRPGA